MFVKLRIQEFFRMLTATLNIFVPVTAIITICLLQCNADASKVISSYVECPAGSLPKNFPHPIDCSLFYVCLNGKAIVKKCPSNLHFNMHSSVCDYPENVNCQKDPQEKAGRETTDHVQCPSGNSRQPVLLPDKKDCGKFYICDAGTPHLKSCQPGLHFNPALHACDYPENAGCDLGVSKKGREGGDVFEIACPLNEDGNPILRPHETDCRKFYTCSNGITLVHVCQHGLHFNSELQACDYPEKAGCEKGVNKKGREGKDGFVILCPLNKDGNPILKPHETDCRKFYTCNNGITLVQVCQHGLHFNAEHQACDYPEKAGCDKGVSKKGREGRDGFDILCPLDKDGNPILKPHETDCRKFYTCSNGITLVHVCQLGLHFNAERQACDYPERAGCEKGINKKGREGKDGFDILCPLNKDGNPILKPHETDCRKFYTCNNGITLVHVCQHGLHFNAELQACDYPEKAGCEKGVTKIPKGKVGKEIPVDKCPLGKDGKPLLVPHETDCRKFYGCSEGFPHLQSCQSGLHFNPILQVCDYPETAGCKTDVAKKEPKGEVIEDNVSMICSGVSKKKTALVPHPNDCSKFIICDSGVSHQKSCPAGLHFSAALQACDYPSKVQCDKMGILRSVGVPSPYCPEVNGKISIFYRHPNNCSIYYLCSHGLAYEFVCPSQLHFNLRLKKCDYEDIAMCPIGSGKDD